MSRQLRNLTSSWHLKSMAAMMEGTGTSKAAALSDGALTRSEARSMRPVTSPDMGDSGGSPWRRPKLALREGESLVFCESLLLGVILHTHSLVSLCYASAQTSHMGLYFTICFSREPHQDRVCRLTVKTLREMHHMFAFEKIAWLALEPQATRFIT